MTKISEGIVISSDRIVKANNDLLNSDISLSEHKETIEFVVSIIFKLYNDYLEVEPPEKMEATHNLFGKAMEYYYSGAEYLIKYIAADDIDGMNEYLGKAVSEIVLTAQYLNEATDSLNKFSE